MRSAALLLALAALALATPAAAQEVGEDGVFLVADQMPELLGGLAAIQPVYPESQRQAGVEGRVIVQFVVNEDGSVSDVAVARGVSPELDAAAVAATEPIRFRPGMDEGRPVKVRFTLPVEFRL